MEETIVSQKFIKNSKKLIGKSKCLIIFKMIDFKRKKKKTTTTNKTIATFHFRTAFVSSSFGIFHGQGMTELLLFG